MFPTLRSTYTKFACVAGAVNVKKRNPLSINSFTRRTFVPRTHGRDGKLAGKSFDSEVYVNFEMRFAPKMKQRSSTVKAISSKVSVHLARSPFSRGDRYICINMGYALQLAPFNATLRCTSDAKPFNHGELSTESVEQWSI